MIKLTTIYKSGATASIRYVGTSDELAEVVSKALKGNVRSIEVHHEQDPYDAGKNPPILGTNPDKDFQSITPQGYPNKVAGADQLVIVHKDWLDAINTLLSTCDPMNARWLTQIQEEITAITGVEHE